jgi:hypothetical protein
MLQTANAMCRAAQARGGPALALQLRCFARSLVLLAPADGAGGPGRELPAGRSAPAAHAPTPAAAAAGKPADREAAGGASAPGGCPGPAPTARAGPDPNPDLWPQLVSRLAALPGVWLPDGCTPPVGGAPAGLDDAAPPAAPARLTTDARCVWVRLGALRAAVRVAMAVAGGRESGVASR